MFQNMANRPTVYITGVCTYERGTWTAERKLKVWKGSQQMPNKTTTIESILVTCNEKKAESVYNLIVSIKLGCPTSYSCHVDSVLLYSKYEAKRIKYWNSNFKYLQIRYSSISRRTWLFQIFLRDIRDIRETNFNA